MTGLILHSIDGRLTEGSGRNRLPVSDPVLGAVARHVVQGTPAAVQAARRAFPGWAATPPLARARVMFRFRDLLEQHAERLAAIITSEHGKVLSDALGEVTRGMEVVEYATAAPELLKGEFTEQAERNIDAYQAQGGHRALAHGHQGRRRVPDTDAGLGTLRCLPPAGRYGSAGIGAEALRSPAA